MSEVFISFAQRAADAVPRAAPVFHSLSLFAPCFSIIPIRIYILMIMYIQYYSL